MSKHIWRRGRVYRARVHPLPTITGETVQFVNLNPKGECNCTVIEDSACFPVREARRLCKAVEVWEQRGVKSNYADALQGLYDAHTKYSKAVARMKAKKGKPCRS